MSDLVKRLRAALDGLAFAAYQQGERAEQKLGECEDVREWIAVAVKSATEAADEITRLRAEVEALRADAERYRWLRATTNTATNSKGERIDVRNMPDRWDAAIDKARKA